MIVKTEKGWVVYSEDRSRRLGGPYKTRGEATERISEVEHFKKEKEGGRYGGGQ